MFKPSLLAAAAVALFAGHAQAAVVDVTLGSVSTSGYSYGTGGTAINPNIDLMDRSQISFTNGAGIAAAGTTFPGYITSPNGTLYGNNFAFATAGSTFTVSPIAQSNSFGFLWSSVDSFNTLTLTDSRGMNYTVTGSEILSALSMPSGASVQENVVISDPFGTIVSAVLTSTTNSFEAANFGTGASAVPLPSSVVLFGMALMGLFAYSRRRSV